MPRFSIILPTYNRRDTIMRAVNSALAQTFADFELLITDDGSTDGTAELLEGIDGRISLQRQANGGIAPARTAALRRSKGEYIAFLDSDDEWLPHHLELTNAFFQAFPNEHLFSGEFWIDYGQGKEEGKYEKHFRASMNWFLPVARRIGLGGLSLPPGETDDYLRFYSTRAEVGEWGRAIVEKLPYEDVRYYTGNLFEHFRWGYLLAAQSTVISRTAFERIGELDTSYPIGCDFGFLALACRYYRAHMVSAPACIKHEYAGKGKDLAEGHLATGATAPQFAKDLLRWHETLFWNDRKGDPELSALRAWAQMYVGRLTLDRGRTDEAISYLTSAVEAFPGPEARLLLLAARSLPAPLARSFAHGLFRAEARYSQITARVSGLLRRPSSASASDAATSKAPRAPSPQDLAEIRLHEASDLRELMELRAATHGPRSIFTDRSYFDWVYSERPRAVGKPSELWLHRSSGRIDGQVGVVPVELKVGETQVDAGWVFDLAVDPSTRGRGTAGALVSVACERVKAAMALEVTGGGRHVLLRGGWSDLGELPLFVRPVGALGNLILLGVQGLGGAGADLMRLVSQEIDRFDERVDEIWSDASGSYPVVVRRDRHLLNWRFADFPHRGRYRLFYFLRDDKPLGYAVLRVGEHHGAPAGYIVDFFCRPRWMYSVLAHCVRHLQRERVAAIYCLHLNPVSMAPLLGLGFIPRRSGWPFVADLRRLSPAAAGVARDPGNWFITAGDGDVDRPGEALLPGAVGVDRRESEVA
jgi:glycosyltransferase involved in cell wall biosynthesis/GNAT superfamily N-acetyltransferase